MVERRRLREDAFAWVRDTTRGQAKSPPAPGPVAAEPLSAETTVEASAVEDATAGSEDQSGVAHPGERSIFVKYRKDTGDIVAIREVLPTRQLTSLPWASIPDDMAVAAFVLGGDLLDKRIIEIHHQYKVTRAGSSTQLTAKT